MRQIIILVFAVFCFSPAVQAESYSQASAYLAEDGVKLYEAGEISAAVHQLSKALLVDPDNIQAKETLNKIGMERGAYGQELPPRSRIARLSQANHIYKSRVKELKQDYEDQRAICADLKNKNSALCKDLDAKTDEAELLKIKIDAVKSERQTQYLLDRATINQLEQEQEDKQRENNLYKRTIKRYLELLDETENEVVAKEQNIVDLSQEIKFVKNESINEIVDYEDRIAYLVNEYESEIQVLKNEIDQKSVENQAHQKAKDTIVNKLNKEIQSKDQQIARLRDQELIKDLELAKNKQELAYLSREHKRPEYVGEMLGTQHSEAGDLLAKIKRKDQHIADLKEKLVKTIQRVNELEKRTKTPDDRQEVVLLKGKVETMQSELQEKDEVLKEKGLDVELLEARLTDVQERLGLVQEIVEEKDFQIKELEDQVILMRNQCVSQ